MANYDLSSQFIKQEPITTSPRGSPPAPAAKKRAHSSASGQRKSRRQAGNDDEDPLLPMSHGGGGSGEAEEADDEVAMVHIEHPMWTELWREVGQRPVDRKHCFGCTRGTLNIGTLPYEGFTTLAQQLPKKIGEHGLFAAVRWAGYYYQNTVIAHVTASDEVQARMAWSGASIVYHFCKHTHMSQFREIIEEAELSYVQDDIMMHQLYVRPAFGSGAPSERRVDPMSMRTLATVRQMLHRQRNVDVKKRMTFHEGLGSSAGVATVPLGSEKFTGQGPLNSRRK